MREILGAGGALSRLDAGFEERPGQLAMAEAVASILATGGVLLAEAGTGTGKTLAYLLPVVASGRRAVVSTATKNLQDQILRKDLPVVEALLGRRLDAVVLKGRSNYLCVLRHAQLRQGEAVRDLDAAQWVRIDAWSEHTATGDRADVPGVPEDAAIWAELTATAESCLGGKCPRYAECHVTRARAAAQAADLVIVNHHLYFGDLAVREAGGEILPAHAAVVFDEAHAVPDTAATFFGRRISDRRVLDWERDARRALGGGAVISVEILLALGAVAPACERLFRRLAPPSPGGRALWRPGEQGPEVEKAWHVLDTALEGAAAVLRPEPDRAEEIAALARRALALRDDLAVFFEPEAPGWVHFVEARDRVVALSAQPIEPADAIRDRLVGHVEAAVLTSATLTVGGGFAYMRQRIGLDDAVEARFESPFDYPRQARLYVPGGLPSPSDPAFPEAVAEVCESLTTLTGGRAFLLFTSYRNLNAVHAILAPRLPFPVLRQGDAPRGRLLEQFRTRPGAVLFATSSFWEGVDVAGDALSLVVMDKLPFESPGDPVLQARIEARREAGGNPFMELQVPAAALALQQGFGRLVRTASDRGIVALLDARVRSRAYGKVLLRSLPPAPVVADFEDLVAWWDAGG